MQRHTSNRIAAWLFVAAALMVWGGWMLLPHQIGTFFEADDFAAVDARLTLWIWMFRLYLFGLVTAVLALVALGAVLEDSDARVLLWPGVAVAAAGLLVVALAGAFYYHFGAWGAISQRARSPEEVAAFAFSLEIATEYITCLVRFGRVFFGLGQVVLVAGLLADRRLPRWVAWSGAVLGVAAMALTMGLPDDLELYRPIFHLDAAWLAAIGWRLFRL
jgi:hypothetical protein